MDSAEKIKKSKATPEKAKHKTFKGGFTAETMGTMLVPFLMTFSLFMSSIRYNPIFPPQIDMVSRSLFVYCPSFIGLLILGISVLTMVQNFKVTVVITPSGIRFKQGSKEFESSWLSLIYQPPPKKGVYKTFVISDGKTIAHINSSFFPKFKLLVELIEAARAQFKSGEFRI
jgi:hypothetical protein